MRTIKEIEKDLNDYVVSNNTNETYLNTLLNEYRTVSMINHAKTIDATIKGYKNFIINRNN